MTTIKLTSLALFATASVNCLNGDTSCDTGLPTTSANNGSVQTILQLTFGVIGALSVIYIVLAGLKFITAQGNPQEAAKARQSIIFAVLGLGVSLSAEAIVTFVLNKV